MRTIDQGDAAIAESEPPRRFALKASLAFLAAVGGGASSDIAQAQSRPLTDVDILNFALNLEYLEAEYYARGLTGSGLTDAEVTGVGNLGGVVGGRQVQFTDTGVQQILTEVGQNERAHVNFIRGALGPAAVARPAINFTDAFNALGRAAGLGPFDPFANQTNFILGGLIFEETGQTAYHGSARFIQSKNILENASGILAVEAYHAGIFRLLTFQAGEAARAAANAAITLRFQLGGGQDEVLSLNGTPNLVPTDRNSLSPLRTPAQVLNIAYEGGAPNNFGFFPNRVNGTIT